MNTTVRSSSLGYPRIGEKREWKKALEQFWTGQIEKADLFNQTEQIRLLHLKKQKEKGIDLIPVGDFSLYDHVLDTAAMFGIVPERFDHKGGSVSLETYFEMARGRKDAPACEMTKWYNSNYHYIVPELDGAEPYLADNLPLQYYREAKEKLGIEGKPVIIGPVTFVKLSKGYDQHLLESHVLKLVPLYAEILKSLEAEGTEWVQLDEPNLSTSIDREELVLYKTVLKSLKAAAPNVKIILQTYFDYIDHYKDVISLPVDAIGMDFIHDNGRNLDAIKKYNFPAEKVLFAGIIDGRNIWRANLGERLGLLQEIQTTVPAGSIVVQPSCSLLHVPVTLRHEEKLPDLLHESLAFADEKLDEIVLLAKGLHEGKEAILKETEASNNAISALNQSASRNDKRVASTLSLLPAIRAEREASFPERHEAQQARFKLPLLPTTTIGSFPQTKEVRQQRLNWRKGQITDGQYDQYIQAEIRKWVDIQEQLGLDVLVHGEFERTDMVEYFGEKLTGFVSTTFGWVQSYGSRCVKPPIIYGDVVSTEAMTVKETVFAQSLTTKPVKGMLTGPITILNWSFVRDDISRMDVANQIALALRNEVELLEASGIGIIQVDEPALREGLPLKAENRAAYLQAAVHAFKLATASVNNETQIHTHMCYANFDDIMDAISGLDADVISIETSRSHGELLQTLEENTYDKGIGLGVYDIHSPHVPKLDNILANIERALNVLDPERFWINPDCGLKTRGEQETIAALEVMVKAADEARKKLGVELQR